MDPVAGSWAPSSCLLHVTFQAALAVWTIILRFMGDLPEPMLYARSSLHGGSMLRQIHDALAVDGSLRASPHAASSLVSTLLSPLLLPSGKLRRKERLVQTPLLGRHHAQSFIGSALGSDSN